MAHYKSFSAIIALCLIVAVSVTVFANDKTPEEVFEKLFTSPSVQPEWFAPEMLAQFSPAQFDAIVEQYVGILGAYESAAGEIPSFRLTFEHGHVNAQLVLNAAGQIAGIWFGPPEPKVEGLDEAAAGFHQLPGEVSFLVISDDGILASINPDVPLAVGSTFKLAVVAALKDQIAAGLRSWDDVVRLEAQDISMPSGILQDWPVGTSLTIESLASLMISISDNTATDTLLRLVGRETVEMYAPRNQPFLTTREAFTLKSSVNADLLDAYRQGDAASRRALLNVLSARPLPTLAQFGVEPMAIDVEWFFTVNELASLIAHVHDLPFMSINPGAATPSDWQHVAFKGGSEPGVLNLTTLVKGDSGTTYIVSATWNNDKHPLDEDRFFGLYSALLSAIRQLDTAN